MVGLIISECKFLVKELGNYSVSFVRRSVIQVAHVLARATDSMYYKIEVINLRLIKQLLVTLQFSFKSWFSFKLE